MDVSIKPTLNQLIPRWPINHSNMKILKNIRIFVILILSAILIISCQNRKSLITIEGDIAGVKDDKLVLAVVTNDGLDILDSVTLKNGHFRFELKADNDAAKARAASPMMYQIMLSPYNTLTTIAMGGDHIIIKTDAENLVDDYTVSGGEEAVLMGQLDSALNSFVQPVDALYRTYRNNIEEDSVRAKIEKQYIQLLDHHKQYLVNFIQEHPDRLASYVAFYQGYNRRSFFSEQEDKALLRKITQTLKKRYPENPYVQNMQRRLEMLDLMEQERNIQHDTH